MVARRAELGDQQRCGVDRGGMDVVEDDDRTRTDLLHRGPDSGGVLAEPGVSLAFRRLAILDPSEKSDQPMTDASGRYSLVFNGEIYNFRRLRAELRTALDRGF